MQSRLACLAAVLLLVVVGTTRAADVRLAGSKLVLRKGPAAERLVLVAHDGVIAPLPGGTEDPTLVGGEVEISNPSTGERARFATSARDWEVNAAGTVFRFRNHLETGPGAEVRTIVIKNRRQLKISARALGITLDEEAQRTLSVIVRTGTRRYCLLFGGKIGKDKPGRFVAHKAPAPAACPGPAIGPSTTTTTNRPPGTRPTTTSVTSSTSTTSTAATLPLPSTSTTSTAPAISTTSTTNAPTATTSSATATVKPTTSTSTSTSSSTTTPPALTTSSTQPPPTTTSTSPPPTTSSTTSVPTTSTTTTTARPCGFRGNSCKGTCPVGLTCAVVLGLCTCVTP